jgi:hypothetical protein
MTLTAAVLGGYLALLPLLRSLHDDRAFPALVALPSNSDDVKRAPMTHVTKEDAGRVEFVRELPTKPRRTTPATPAPSVSTQPAPTFVASSVTSNSVTSSGSSSVTIRRASTAKAATSKPASKPKRSAPVTRSRSTVTGTGAVTSGGGLAGPSEGPSVTGGSSRTPQ